MSKLISLDPNPYLTISLGSVEKPLPNRFEYSTKQDSHPSGTQPKIHVPDIYRQNRKDWKN